MKNLLSQFSSYKLGFYKWSTSMKCWGIVVSDQTNDGRYQVELIRIVRVFQSIRKSEMIDRALLTGKW